MSTTPIEVVARPGSLGRILDALKTPRVNKIAKGVISAAGAKILVSAASLLTLPIAVRYLGAERYGVWVTVTTITSWIASLELGISNTLTNSISTSFAKNDKDGAARYTSNAIAITLSLSAVVGVICALVWKYVNWARLFNISKQVAGSDVRLTVGIAFALVLLAPTCTLGAKILSGYQETYVYNAITAAGAITSLLAMFGGVVLHCGMPMLFFITAGSITASSLCMLLWILFVHKPWLRPSVAYLDRRVVGELLSTGSAFFVTQIACLVIFSTDNLIVAHYLGAAEVTPYSVTMRLAGYAQLLPLLLFPSLWPAYSEAHTRGDYAWVRRTFTIAMKGSLITMAIALPVFVAVGRKFIGWWAGPQAVPSYGLLVAMAVWVVLIAITGVQACLLNAVGRIRIQAILVASSAVVNLALSVFLVKRVGSIGAVLGTIVSYLLIIIGPQIWITTSYFREVLPAAGISNESKSAGLLASSGLK